MTRWEGAVREKPQQRLIVHCLSSSNSENILTKCIWITRNSNKQTWTIQARDARRIIAAEMKYMRRTAGYTWTDYKTITQIMKELKITPILDKLLEYKRKWIQHVNRMPCTRLPRVVKHYSPTGRRNHGRPLKRVSDTWDQNGSTSGPTPWQI